MSTWLKNKDTLRKAHGNCAPAQKRLRAAKHSDAKAALDRWFEDAKPQNITVSG